LLSRKVYKYQDPEAPRPLYINLKNGLLNLNSLELQPHTPEVFITVQLPVNYYPDKQSHLWIQTLTEIFDDDSDKINVLQQFFGYCLYPRILFPCALFQIGSGGNGKGLVENVLGHLLGQENCCHISLRRMERQWGPAEIKDKLLNSCSETEIGALDVTTFKALAAGDWIQGERKFKDDIKFRPFAKHLVSMNSWPSVREKSDAFFRRVIVLEYLQKFEGENRDVHRLDKLGSELDAILSWAVDGLQYVLEKNSFWIPDCCKLAKERFREQVNPVLLFGKECCIVAEWAWCERPKLFSAYRAWCEDSGLRALGKKTFYQMIDRTFPVRFPVRKGTKDGYGGIGLLTDDDGQDSLPI
jgi:putative DNA primase/helicase